jgi:hypothetical protein
MRLLFFFSIILVPTCCISQKEDYRWIVGHDLIFSDNIFGSSLIDFNAAPPSVKLIEFNINMNMFELNSCISDSTGELVFYSNGCDVADLSGNYIENGRDINPGFWHDQLCDDLKRGYAAGYPSAVILQLPQSGDLYYLFHKSAIYVQGPPQDAYIDKLLYTVVLANDNEKLVTQKNMELMADSLAAGEMGAVKHANGKDWWLFTPRRNSNTFYTFLFTAEGIVDTLVQTIGDLPPVEEESSGQTTFSHDGSTLARY